MNFYCSLYTVINYYQWQTW